MPSTIIGNERTLNLTDCVLGRRTPTRNLTDCVRGRRAKAASPGVSKFRKWAEKGLDPYAAEVDGGGDAELVWCSKTRSWKRVRPVKVLQFFLCVAGRGSERDPVRNGNGNISAIIYLQ